MRWTLLNHILQETFRFVNIVCFIFHNRILRFKNRSLSINSFGSLNGSLQDIGRRSAMYECPSSRIIVLLFHSLLLSLDGWNCVSTWLADQGLIELLSFCNCSSQVTLMGLLKLIERRSTKASSDRRLSVWGLINIRFFVGRS